jgi:diguanylate cyclase (GGDEF)-like protein/PAS domain S-box-containing protein
MASAMALQAPAETDSPKILVVDDNADKRVALRAMLAPLGHTVLEAASGRAALALLLRETVAMILMDVRMPTLNGFETAKLCRSQIRGGRTPIIFVTAMGSENGETASAYASGAVDFIFTPVLPEVLRAKVTAFVDLFTQSQRLQQSLDSITELNSALRDSDVLTQAVLDNVAEGIFILDEHGRIESVNRSVGRLFGYHAQEPVGHSFAFMIDPSHREELRALDTVEASPAASAGRGPPKRAIETVGFRQDGSKFAIELERSEIEHGERRLTLASVRDISERKAYTEALEHQALHDGLTGLANRVLFSAHLSRALASARRTNQRRAVLVMDLDGFKQVNDTLGHDRGDTLLRQLGARLVAALREGDTVARLGGDEFAILAADATDLEGAAAMAWKIQQACEQAFTIDDTPVDVSTSIGIALFPEHGTTTAELLHRADLAMYVAKRSGHGHAVFDAAHERQAEPRLAHLVDLRQCVSREQLVLHYQPKIELASGKIFGVEALVRWQHPTHGLLAPASFMPEVERTDLIVPVTNWVLSSALSQQRAWRDAGIDLTMAVNVSARSLGSESSLPEEIAKLKETWGTAAGELILELTESGLIEAAAPDMLTRLHGMGEKLSIDDFGTGYSSLAYLQRLPVDELKIDRSFVTSLADVSDDAIIVRSTIDLAHNLGLRVVAEGVEDEAVMRILTEYGCDAAQGYFFSRPVTAEEITEQVAPAPAGVRR